MKQEWSKRVLGTLAMILVAALSGCVATNEVAVTTPVVISTVLSGQPLPAPPNNQTWVMPAISVVDHMRPGDSISWNIEVHNGGNTTDTWILSIDQPNTTIDNNSITYKIPIELDVASWFTVDKVGLDLFPGTTKDVKVTLSMPKYIIAFSSNWAYWITATRTAVNGIVQQQANGYHTWALVNMEP